MFECLLNTGYKEKNSIDQEELAFHVLPELTNKLGQQKQKKPPVIDGSFFLVFLLPDISSSLTTVYIVIVSIVYNL